MVSPLALPEPDEEHLTQSPLKLVVCQVRHSRTVAVSDAGRILEVQGCLGDSYPEALPFEQHEVVFEVGPEGGNVGKSQSQQGWQLKSDDAAWTVTLQTDFLSIETSAYVDWVDFRDRYSRVLDCVADIYAPKLEQRVGLRYVDVIERADLQVAHDWRGLISDTVLGLASDTEIGPSVRLSHQIVEMEAPEHMRVLLRHGCERMADGQGTAYQLDHDCYRQQTRGFETSVILATMDDLHRLALQVFQHAVTPKLYAELKGGVATS